MTQIWERLWVGGLTDAERLVKGNPNGIDTVISLSELAVRSKRDDVTYVHIPIGDDLPVPIRQFYSIMDSIRKNIRWGTVLLHCGVGISRAPSFAAAYMDAVGYKHIDAAIEDIRQMRPIIAPSTILLNRIKEHLR
jgi:protein-tyrosine phosphatase